MPYCPHCGAQTTPNDRFCISCGKPLAGASAPPSAQAAPPNVSAAGTPAPSTPQHRTWRKIGCGCLTALLVFVLLIFSAAMCATRDAKEVARAHLNRIKAGETDSAYQQLSPDAQAAISCEQYAALIAERPILRGVETIFFPEFERNNNTVTLKARAHTAAGIEFDIPVQLRKESGQWYIVELDLNGVPAGSTSSKPVPSVEKAPVPPAEENPGAGYQSSASVETSSAVKGTPKAREAALRHVA